MEREPCVYLLAATSHGTFYTGVTSDLVARIRQHRTEALGGFTARHGIKHWARQWKYDLVNAGNPTWRDLAEDFGFEPQPLQRKADPGSSPG